MSRWYKVEFMGELPEGWEPTIGIDMTDDDRIDLAGELAPAFGFRGIAHITVSEIE